jgi:glycosyltransferase involved in cell wall biosynthesis
MKVAIIHDELMRRGGAEQVVLTMLKSFPTADIYTLAYNGDATYPEYGNYKINTSVFQVFAKNVKVMHSLFFPFGIMAMKAMKITGYDVVIISNTHCAKYVKIDAKSKVFMYTHTPFRLAWNPTSYTQYIQSKGLYRLIFDTVISCLRRIDANSAKRGDFFIANTTQTALRIKEAYKIKQVFVIKPDVKVRNFYISEKPKKYYLLVSRLEYYKKVDLAIEAFNQLGLNLIIVGDGTKAFELRALAKSNISFVTNASNEELANFYANCEAFIFPQHEDYGITPLEANASGRPVIAYGKGGVLETMIPYTGDASKCTALFFENQTVSDLAEAVLRYSDLKFDANFIRSHAEKFDESVFIKTFRRFVLEKLNGKLLKNESASSNEEITVVEIAQ